MLKKFGLSLLVLAIFALFSSVLMAQTPLTQADVDLFIKVSQAADPEAQAKVITDSGIDPNAYGLAQGKIVSVAGMLYQNVPEDTIKAGLAQNPVTAITDDEFALLIGQKDALIEAFKALTKVQ
jgi:hypothetical protein